MGTQTFPEQVLMSRWHQLWIATQWLLQLLHMSGAVMVVVCILMAAILAGLVTKYLQLGILPVTLRSKTVGEQIGVRMDTFGSNEAIKVVLLPLAELRAS